MNKLQKWIITNCLISFLMFSFIIFTQVGKSGGDIAIYIFNILFGVFQVLVVLFLIRKRENKYYRVIFFIILFQAIEILILHFWGFRINEFLKSYV